MLENINQQTQTQTPFLLSTYGLASQQPPIVFSRKPIPQFDRHGSHLRICHPTWTTLKSAPFQKPHILPFYPPSTSATDRLNGTTDGG